jgi:protein-histidine N-methyltransferase
VVFNFVLSSYVAAKTVYFGVGGGILPFCNLLSDTKDESGDKMKYEKVFESTSTVMREILKVSWDL